MVRLALQVGAVFLVGLGASAARGAEPGSRIPQMSELDKPVWSPDGLRLAFTSANDTGVFVYEAPGGQVLTLAGAASSGSQVRWSADGARLAFKDFVPGGDADSLLQVPAFYDFAARRRVALTNPVGRCGVPSFSRDGRVAFTAEDWLVVLGRGLEKVARWRLGAQANLAALSPDGSTVAFSDERDAIWLLEVASGARRRLTSQGEWTNPLWSGDGALLLVGGTGGAQRTVEIATGRSFELPPASRAVWLPDARTLVFATAPDPDDGTAPDTDLHLIGFDGRDEQALTATPGALEGAPGITPDGRRLIYRIEGQGLAEAALERVVGRGASLGEARRALEEVSGWESLRGEDAPASALGTRRSALTAVEAIGVPYIHQYYDTNDSCTAAGSACGPTSAMMTVAYRDLLGPKPRTYHGHSTDWGYYVCDPYSYNGYSYAAVAHDGTRAGQGAFGFVWAQGVGQVRYRLRDFLKQHKIQSAYDESDVWARVKAELDDRQPCVLRTNLMGGHYIVATGYVPGKRTMVINDPWGNKNLTTSVHYFSRSGEHVLYDWPGEQNGHANIGAVYGTITSRYSTPAKGTLKGSVYAGSDTSAHVAQAAVTVKSTLDASAAQKTATTDANGAFSLSLGPDVWAITVSKAGFTTKTKNATVLPRETTRVQFSLAAAASKGTFKGFVYRFDPAQPGDRSVKLPSAQVALDGGAWQAVEAGTAAFSFSVAPGAHSVAARLAGYQSNSTSRTIAANQETVGNVGLAVTGSTSVPGVVIESPLEGAFLDAAAVLVSGSLENATGVAQVEAHWAGQVATGAVQAGSFEVPIVVAPGDTAVEVWATNAAGTGKASVTVHFNTGLCGVVEQETPDGETAAIADATVEVNSTSDRCSTTALQQATSGAGGEFCFDLPPGDWALRVRAPGKLTVEQDVTVGVEEREHPTLRLADGSDPVPSLRIDVPAAGADGKLHVTEPTVSIEGTVVGMSLGAVALDGQALDLGDFNTFKAPALPVALGETSLTFTATGTCQQTASLTVVVVRTAPAVPERAGCHCASGGLAQPLAWLAGLAWILWRRRAGG